MDSLDFSLLRYNLYLRVMRSPIEESLAWGTVDCLSMVYERYGAVICVRLLMDGVFFETKLCMEDLCYLKPPRDGVWRDDTAPLCNNLAVDNSVELFLILFVGEACMFRILFGESFIIIIDEINLSSRLNREDIWELERWLKNVFIC